MVYLNANYNIAGMTGSDYPASYKTFDYGRAMQVTNPIMEAVFNNEPYVSADGTSVTDFTRTADDALQVIDFVYSRIHPEC